MSTVAKRRFAGGSIPSFDSATIGDVIRPGVMSCPPNTSLVTVAETMTAHNIHALVVSDVSSRAPLAATRVGG